MILAGDVGGTKIALGLFERQGDDLERERVETFASEDYNGLASAVRAFFKHAEVDAGSIESTCFGVAGPVLDNRAQAPNLAWEIDGDAVAEELGLGGVWLINDLLATAEGIPTLAEHELAWLQEGEADADGNAALIAAGTGLGMCLLPRVEGRLVPVATEGGHQSFAPRNAMEVELMRRLEARYGRVSVERVVSGPGLVALYHHLRETGTYTENAELRDRIERTDAGSAISRAALEDGDPLASAALDAFVSAYGAAAGDLALVGLATGGVFVGGGIAPKILARLQDGPFLDAFRAKGRFRDLVSAIPVRVILNPRTALRGAAQVAAGLGLRHPSDGPA
jgi:glucokinase